MKQVVLVMNSIKNDYTLIKLAEEYFANEKLSTGQVNVYFSHERLVTDFLSISSDDNIGNLLEPDEQQRLDSILPGQKSYFLIEFKNFTPFRLFVSVLYHYADFIVDNDFGYFYNKESFLKAKTYEEFIANKSNTFL